MKSPPPLPAALIGGLTPGWSTVRRLLAVRLDNLGDLLMTTPALAAIRHALPAAHVTLLASPAGAALARHIPPVDDVMAFEAPWVQSAPRGLAAPASLGQAEGRLIDRLAAGHFDAAVIFTVCTQSALPAALLCRMAGIPLRLAYSRENAYDLLTHRLPETDVIATGMRHEVQRQLDLVASQGMRAPHDGLVLRCERADELAVRRRLCDAGLNAEQPYFVVHPGATVPSRRYPAPAFGTAAGLIARDSGCTAIYTGGEEEIGLVEAARAAMGQPSLSLAGALSLGELAALVAGARLLLANNSGPAHIAAAVGTPVVDLYALTNPQHTPWKVPVRVLNHDVPCRHCLKSVCPQGHHDCLRKVQPAAVAAAARELMAIPTRHEVRHDASDRANTAALAEPAGAPA